LVGYGASGVVRYQPATGELTITPVPTAGRTNNVSFVVTQTAEIIQSRDPAESYLVVDGKPPEPLPGLLPRAAKVLPGPDPNHVWLVTSNNAAPPALERMALVLADTHGRAIGRQIDLPEMLAGSRSDEIWPDGAGYALISGLGGTYDVRPSGVHLITHGEVVAAGPTSFLVYDCDRGPCSAAVVDRTSGASRILAGVHVRALTRPGPISSNGRYAAVLQPGSSSMMVQIIDLRTGKTHIVRLDTFDAGGAQRAMTFSPDGHYLIVASPVRTIPIDTGTGKRFDSLPIPPVSALAVRQRETT